MPLIQKYTSLKVCFFFFLIWTCFSHFLKFTVLMSLWRRTGWRGPMGKWGCRQRLSLGQFLQEGWWQQRPLCHPRRQGRRLPCHDPGESLWGNTPVLIKSHSRYQWGASPNPGGQSHKHWRADHRALHRKDSLPHLRRGERKQKGVLVILHPFHQHSFKRWCQVPGVTSETSKGVLNSLCPQEVCNLREG